jgi:hypothetical protein
MPAKWSKPCRIHAVRCPHCGERNDCRNLDFAILSDANVDSKHQKLRPQIECDDCGKLMEVVKVEQPILVWVRPIEQASGFSNVPTEEEQAEFMNSPEYEEWMRKREG